MKTPKCLFRSFNPRLGSDKNTFVINPETGDRLECIFKPVKTFN